MAKNKMLYTNSEVKKEMKKRHRNMLKEARKELEQQTQKQEKIIMFEFKKEQENIVKEKEKRKQEIEIKTNFLYEKAKVLTYQNWLTLRDILYNNYFQIESDIKHGKITQETYNKLINISKECTI